MKALALKVLVLALVAPVVATAGEGDTLHRDGLYAEALAAWEREASRGNADAAWRLGAALADGVVVPRDRARAVHWLAVAAEAGQIDAQVDLGTAYDRGEGVAASPREAARWYRRAAERGHAAGQFNLASMYEHGEGVALDPVEAWAWYALAAGQGMRALASAPLERIASALDAARRAEAAARARRYEAAYAGAHARVDLIR